MKQRTNTTTVTTNIIERQAFTIKATGKAFRSLIDGIYSNKILAPVRELMTNAYDGHLMAGNEDQAFHVKVPDHSIPEFAVRDYGIGMDHETVTGLYTTLFDSSKDDTNSQVGMLGLGSKSPFAYTDTFTVTCYDGETKRVYNAHLDDDVPQLGLMFEGESAEPRGVEVKFPVRSGDYASFVAAIKRVALGFDVMPTFEGADIEDRPVVHEGTGYRVYKRDDGYWSKDPLAAVNVRMGCVIYPVEALTGTGFESIEMPRQVAYVVDVPIGASDVTTNREALANDDQSVEGIRPFLEMSLTDHKDTVVSAYKAAKTTIEKAKVLSTIDYEWRRAFDLPLNLMVSLMNDGWDTETKNDTLKRRRPGYFVEHGSKRRQVAYEVRYDNIASIEIIIDDDETVRRRSRVRDHVQARYDKSVYVVPAGHAKVTVPRLKKLWGLEDSQFKNVADLMDPGPPVRNAGSAGGSRAKVSDLKARLDEGQPWIHRMRDKHWTLGYADGGIKATGEAHLVGHPFVIQALGLEDVEWGTSYWEYGDKWAEHVVMLTDKQVEKLNPPAEQELGYVLRQAWEDMADQEVEAVKDRILHGILREWMEDAVVSFEGQRYTDRFMVADEVLKAQGFTSPSLDEVWLDGLGVVEAVGQYGLAERRHFRPEPQLIQDLKDALRREFPALFRRDRQEVLNYIQGHGS
jgi:hypothetical protein